MAITGSPTDRTNGLTVIKVAFFPPAVNYRPGVILTLTIN